METSVRLDKWLWAARFFKTRSLAREAVAGGKVHLNGNRAKPGRSLNCGDELRIQRGDGDYCVTVLDLCAQRGSAAVAQARYRESEESRAERERLTAARKLEQSQCMAPDRRPDKRQRRRLIRFKNGLD